MSSRQTEQPASAPTALIVGSTQHRVRLRDIDFSYLEWGDAGAPPLVLLHGLTGHAHTWDHMAPQLAERYHILAPDQRGHGDSGAGETYATQDFVDDLEALRQHWGIDHFVLMGLSMGGHNSMAYTASHAERVSRLIVIDIAPKMDRRKAPNWDVISKLAVTGHKRYATFDDAFVDARAATATAPDDNLRYRTENNLRTLEDGTMMLKYDPKAPAHWQPEDLTSKVASIEVPVLLVRGGLSTVLPREAAERMVAMFMHAELVEVPDSGHSVPTDRPEALLPIVLEWLRR